MSKTFYFQKKKNLIPLYCLQHYQPSHYIKHLISTVATCLLWSTLTVKHHHYISQVWKCNSSLLRGFLKSDFLGCVSALNKSPYLTDVMFVISGSYPCRFMSLWISLKHPSWEPQRQQSLCLQNVGQASMNNAKSELQKVLFYLHATISRYVL